MTDITGPRPTQAGANTVTFTVPGTPAPQGSKRQVRTTHGRHLLIDDNPATRPWRDTVRWHAIQARGQNDMFTGPVHIHMLFTLPRPKNHYRRDGTLKPTAPHWHPNKPDLDKLARAALDSLTGSLIRDDSQVASLTLRKHYDEQPQLTVTIRALT